MFFVLSKLLSILISPLFWLVLTLLLWLLLKNKKWKKKFKISFVVLFFLFTNKFTALQFQRLWEVEGTKIENVDNDYDVAIVLGGMAEFNNDLNRISIRKGSDRIWNAIRLYKMGKVKKILISGDDGQLIDKGLNEAQTFKKHLIELGIPEEDILTEIQSKNTYENAKMTYEVLKDHQLTNKKILLITSAMHMKRAAACFKNQGLTFDVYTTDHNTGSFYFDFGQIFIPDAHAIELWNQLFHEWAGYVIYKILGYA